MQGKYHIKRRLGQGGMAEVFEGELTGELGFRRAIAIKRVLPEAAADPAAARRFLDEARIASRLHHANIVSVLDVGLLEGLPFQVLELVDGLNAQQLLQRAGGSLPPAVALHVAAEVAHGLDHAHTAADASGVPFGIVHRDVKPSNVLVSWAGDVKLSDFGIAHAFDRASKTETGVVAGTHGFMAPEQRWRGTIDGRTDVYALGLTLHALLTGRSPLAELVAELAALDGGPVALAPAIAPDIAAVLARALAPERAARPSAKELAAELARLAAAHDHRDRRSVLQAFLGTVTTTPARRGGALDHLLGLALVAEPDADDGLVHYELQPEPTAPPPVRPDDPPTAPARPRPAPPRRRALLAAGALAVTALGGVGLWRVLGAAHTAPPPDASAPHIALAAPIDAAAPPPPPVDAAPAPPPVDAAPAPHAPPRGRPHPAPTPTPTPTPAAPPAGTGYLQIAGPGLIGARVLVDGVVRGYPPAKIELPRGHHAIVVERPDGTRTAPRDVEITDLHTLASPARPTL